MTNSKNYAGSPTRVRFSTTGYQFDNGHGPRGFGSWAFSMGRDYNEVDEVAEDGEARVVWFNGMRYGEAKKAAAKVARDRGFETVVVCS